MLLVFSTGKARNSVEHLVHTPTVHVLLLLIIIIILHAKTIYDLYYALALLGLLSVF